MCIVLVRGKMERRFGMRYVKSGRVNKTGYGVLLGTSNLLDGKRREKVWSGYLIIVEKLLDLMNS